MELESIKLVTAERIRQIEKLGWSLERDKELYSDNHELEDAACAYILADSSSRAAELIWPWTDYSFKPRTHKENLVKAAALLMAAIDLEG